MKKRKLIHVNTEARKALSGYIRTISLGFMAVALIETIRNTGSISQITSITAFIVALFTLGVSITILNSVKETEE